MTRAVLINCHFMANCTWNWKEQQASNLNWVSSASLLPVFCIWFSLYGKLEPVEMSASVFFFVCPSAWIHEMQIFSIIYLFPLNEERTMVSVKSFNILFSTFLYNIIYIIGCRICQIQAVKHSPWNITILKLNRMDVRTLQNFPPLLDLSITADKTLTTPAWSLQEPWLQSRQGTVIQSPECSHNTSMWVHSPKGKKTYLP